jgi:hypothetical protein
MGTLCNIIVGSCRTQDSHPEHQFAEIHPTLNPMV